MYGEPVLKDGLVIVRLWWEQVGADEVAMRARVTVGDAPTGLTSAASTVDGITDAVRASVERFLACRPACTRADTGRP